MKIEGSHENWRYKYLYVIYYFVTHCYVRWIKMKELGIDDDGYVVTKSLAKRILKLWVRQNEGVFEGEKFDEKDIFYSDCNGGWNLTESLTDDGLYPSYGYNGIIIRRYEDEFMDYKDNGWEDNDQISEEITSHGLVILEGDNSRELFIFNEGD